MFERYAAITTSAKILSHVLSTDIDITKIKDYFIDYHTHTVSERSLADKAIEVVTQFVAQNRGKFSDDTALKNMIENYGLIALKDDYKIKVLLNLTVIELRQNEQLKMTMVRNSHLSFTI